MLLRSVVSPQEVPLYLEEAIIDSIGSIKAFLELTDIDRDVAVKQVQCKVFDKDGNEIVGLDPKVEILVETAKEIPVSLCHQRQVGCQPYRD